MLRSNTFPPSLINEECLIFHGNSVKLLFSTKFVKRQIKQHMTCIAI